MIPKIPIAELIGYGDSTRGFPEYHSVSFNVFEKILKISYIYAKCGVF